MPGRTGDCGWTAGMGSFRVAVFLLLQRDPDGAHAFVSVSLARGLVFPRELLDLGGAGAVPPSRPRHVHCRASR